jgi:flagellin-like protein
MNQQDRAVTPVIATILMVAVMIVLAATISVFFFGVTEDINEPAPNVADTKGEFEIEGDWRGTQIVQITHVSGDNVAVEQIEIVVRASGPDVDTEARLVNLPAEGTTLDAENLNDPNNLIDDGNINRNSIIIDEDSNVWATGSTITFRINTGVADFRKGEDPEADELEIIIVHTESNTIISEHVFRP